MRCVCKNSASSWQHAIATGSSGVAGAMDAFMQASWNPGDTLDYLAELAVKSNLWRGFEGQTHHSQCLCGDDAKLCKEVTVRSAFVHTAGRPLSRLGDVGYRV